MIRRITDPAKLSLTLSVETLCCQFLQRCSVSGTAKGKAKLKAGLQLKRSKLTIKKGAQKKKSAPQGGSRLSESQQLISDCLRAPTPLRHLTAKQRAREAEWEKLGLISKARQLEIDMLKKKAKEERVNEGKEKPQAIMGTPGFDFITLGLVDAEAIPKYELTVEDGRRLAKEYSRVLMRRHRARQAAESTLLRLKKEAIEALPEHLKGAAVVPDLTPFPANRFMATLTPPIEGYAETVQEAAKKSSMRTKIR